MILIIILFIHFSTLQMLTAIEGRMEELFEDLEDLPAEKVEAAEKVSIICYDNYCTSNNYYYN